MYTAYISFIKEHSTRVDRYKDKSPVARTSDSNSYYEDGVIFMVTTTSL